jgi:predicted transcriptional regulator
VTQGVKQSEIFTRYNDRHPGDLLRLWNDRREKAIAAGVKAPCDVADSAVSKYLQAKGLATTAYGFTNWRRKRKEFRATEENKLEKPQTLRELAIVVNLYCNENDIPEVNRPVILSYAAVLYGFPAPSVAEFLECSVSAVINSAREYQGMEASDVIRELNSTLTTYVSIHAG